MSYRVGWGRRVGSAVIDSAEELDAVLDGINPGPDDMPYCVSISVAEDNSTIPVMLQIGIGDPSHSFVFYVGKDDYAAWASLPDVDETTDLVIDYAGVATDMWPERTRVTPAAARRAAREFVTGGGSRPSGFEWS